MTDSEERTPSSSSSSDGPPQSAFGRWLKKAGLATGIGVTREERLAHLAAEHRYTQNCEKTKARLMEQSPAVVFMLKHLKLAGCEVPAQNVVCMPCDTTRAGGFAPRLGTVMLCAGQFFDESHVETTIVHELMHMYDHCRFKVDWTNLRHHACAEIRANSLSGDCRYGREVLRGFFSFSKQHQDCVRRRSADSLENNPACADRAMAERAVNEVFESCFSDTRPFDEIY